MGTVGAGLSGMEGGLARGPAEVCRGEAGRRRRGRPWPGEAEPGRGRPRGGGRRRAQPGRARYRGRGDQGAAGRLPGLDPVGAGPEWGGYSGTLPGLPRPSPRGPAAAPSSVLLWATPWPLRSVLGTGEVGKPRGPECSIRRRLQAPRQHRGRPARGRGLDARGRSPRVPLAGGERRCCLCDGTVGPAPCSRQVTRLPEPVAEPTAAPGSRREGAPGGQPGEHRRAKGGLC